MQMSRLRELQELSLSNNPLREVPDVVYKLTTLEVLGLRSCMLKKLSNRVVRLRKLKKVRWRQSNTFVQQFTYYTEARSLVQRIMRG